MKLPALTPAITCPTLIITGDEDFGNGPDMARAIANDISDAEVHILNRTASHGAGRKPNAAITHCQF